MNEETYKPTLKTPTPQGAKFEKSFKKTLSTNNVKLNETDELLNEAERSLKKKIFNLPKMEALVFSDPKLTAKYDEMAENGDEKFGYHWNETVMNILFNDYVLNSQQYLQKYKMAIPKEKTRRDQSGINQLKKIGKQKMNKKKPQSGIDLKKPDVDESNEPLTKVQFLVNEKDPENPDLFAYFPEEEHNAIHKTGYSHVGQHSGVHPEYAAESRPATPEEYASLKAELEGQGYVLDVINDVQETTGAAGGGAGAFTPALGYEKKVEETTTSASSGQYSGPSAWGDGDLKKGKRSPITSKPIWQGGSIIQENNYLIDPKGFEKYIDMLNEQIDITNPTDAQKPNVSAYTNKAVNDKIIDKTSAFTSDTVKKWDKPDTEAELETVNTGKIEEESKSKSQQRFFGMVDAMQKGKLSPDKVGGDVAKAAKSMKHSDVKDFASTKHEDLPEKINESLHDTVEYVSDRNGENPFELHGIKWQFVNAKYPNGKIDIGVSRFGHDLVYDYAWWKEAMGIDKNNNIKEDSQTMIQDKQDSMSNKATPIGSQGGGNVPMGMNSSGGGMNEDFKLLEELNKELNAYSIHHNKLKAMTEDKKTSSMVNVDRLGGENSKNFKKDLQHSGTKEIIDVEKELQWKDQQEEVGKDPQKFTSDLEKEQLKKTKGTSFENVGDSANKKGNEIPKRNMTDDEKKEVDLYRKGMEDLDYDNEPSDKFVDRMKADMGDDLYKKGQDAIEAKHKEPLYNKDPQPTFNDAKTKIKESISGKYFDVLGKKRIISFTLNEVHKLANVSDCENYFELNLSGMGNGYDNMANINEGVTKMLNESKFYTDGENIYMFKSVQTLNENDSKKKTVINEQFEKMKHLTGYDPKNFVNTKGTKENRGF